MIVLMAIIHKGFTVVELLIVVVVIVLLAGLGAVSYRSVQSRANETTVKSDALKISEMIEAAYTKNNAYPTTLNQIGTIPTSKNNSPTYVTTGQAYCLTVSSTIAGVPVYSVANDGKVTEGDCTAAGYVAAGGGGGGGGPVSFDGPAEVRGGCVTGGMGWEWDTPPSSQVPEFAVDEGGYGAYIVENDLPSGGEFFHSAGQGAQGTGTLHVQFINANGDYSETTTGTATFYGDCYD